MYCKFCGKEIEENANYCPHCGKNLKHNDSFSAEIHISNEQKSRTIAGILNIIVPGVGRLYLGYIALGIIELILGWFLWGLIDGILILTGCVATDADGNPLKD